MALKSDDFDIRKNHMYMHVGGNGDYYINFMREDATGSYFRDTMRISMSGGFAPHEVKMAVFRLYQAMEQHGLNLHPQEEKIKENEKTNP